MLLSTFEALWMPSVKFLYRNNQKKEKYPVNMHGLNGNHGYDDRCHAVFVFGTEGHLWHKCNDWHPEENAVLTPNSKVWANNTIWKTGHMASMDILRLG